MAHPALRAMDDNAWQLAARNPSPREALARASQALVLSLACGDHCAELERMFGAALLALAPAPAEVYVLEDEHECFFYRPSADPDAAAGGEFLLCDGEGRDIGPAGWAWGARGKGWVGAGGAAHEGEQLSVSFWGADLLYAMHQAGLADWIARQGERVRATHVRGLSDSCSWALAEATPL